jgi:lysosomal Pro-X carboxypeptidase
MRGSYVSALLFFAVMAMSTAARARPRRIGGWRQAEAAPGRPSTVNCTWGYFPQKIDHFGDTPGTFPQRYCMYTKWWGTATAGGFKAAADAPGPILFYTGNESPVEEYINNTGLMWELGEEMSALLIFAEHRYEPLSHPGLCNNGTQKCFAYCTTAQANADWGTLIAFLRAKHTIRAPAVAFGGSYGGMLAGWFRMKYPDIIDGAIAASAPIWQLAETVRTETLDMQAVAITKGVSAVGGATDQCRDNLQMAWPLLREVGLLLLAITFSNASIITTATSPSHIHAPHTSLSLYRWIALTIYTHYLH